MEEDANSNIYDDLPDFRYDRTLDQLNASIAKLEVENHELQFKIVRLIDDRKTLEKDHKRLNTNFSSLLKTARSEIRRKDRTISELREQLNKLMPQKKRFGLKRRGETAVVPSPKKRAKMSPRKIRDTPRKHETRSKLNPEVVVSDRRDKVSSNVETPSHVEDRLASRKEKQSSKESKVTNEPLPSENCAGPKMAEPVPEIAAPVLPALECPTLFSSRMYKKLYGRDCPTTTAGGLVLPSDTIQSPVVGKTPRPSKLLKNPPSLNTESSKQPSSSYLSSRVSSKDANSSVRKCFPKDTYSSSSDSSRSNSPLRLQCKAADARNVEPQNCNGGFSSKVTRTYAPELHKHGQRPPGKSEMHISQPPAVELHKHGGPPPEELMKVPISQPQSVEFCQNDGPPPEKLVAPVSQPRAIELNKQDHIEHPPETSEVPISLPRAAELHKHDEPPPEKSEVPISHMTRIELNKHVEHSPTVSVTPETKDISSNVDIEPSRAKKSVAKGLLAVGKTRQQTVAAIRPLQTLAAQETPAVHGKSGENNLVAHEPTENSPESKITETSPNVHSSEKANRLSKIPKLSGSTRGRTGRRMFAPISHAWNYPQPNVGNKNDKVSREISVVKTVSVTSELTVRVDDSKPEELNTQLLFGSPVKWADDSLDSPKAEKPADSRKMYSIFGSPCIDKSSSSEHQFSVPPGAYEDSCWTSQIPEKVPTEPAAQEAALQKLKSSEPVAETKLHEKANTAEKAFTTNTIFPPPSSSVIKKHVSIFSPSKDSKHSLSIKVPDEPSRSNTGICFPFPKYEDSVLGQFDDTAQFVSALAKVDTEISPLNTPVKSGNGGDDGEETPTSFQQVFKARLHRESLQNHDPTNLGGTGEVAAEENHNRSLPKCSSSDQSSGTQQYVFSGQNNEYHEAGLMKTAVETAKPQPQKTAEPPAITITPPKTGTSSRIIHRPNFASSTILSVKSWFPNAPVKMVVPRKTPRVVSNANRSASPKDLELSAGARIAINDAFIIEQEERVRRWEQYDSTTRSGSGSPLKSPTRKRIESPGKISPSKRLPKKQVSPSKIARRPELSKLGVEQNHGPLSSDTRIPCVAANKESSGHQPVPDSARTEVVVVYSEAVASCQTSTEPIKSSPDLTQKLLSMINGLMVKTKPTEPGVESSLAEGTKPEAKIAPMPIDSSAVSVETRIEAEAVALHKSNDRCGSEPPRSIIEHQHVPSHGAVLDTVESCTNSVRMEVCATSTTKEQDLPVDHSDPAVSPHSPSPCTPLLFHGNSPGKPAPGSKENISEPIRTSSADAIVLPPGSSNVSSADSPKSSFNDRGRPTGPCKEEKKQGETLQNSNDHRESSNRPNGRRGRYKYSALLSRVKPSTPLNKAFAALVTNSNNPASSPSPKLRWTVCTPSVPSTKKINFKRSSALKPNTGNGAGKLRDSITSTFYRGAPTCSAKANSSCAQMTPTPNIQPCLNRSKSSSSLSSNSSVEVTVETTAHTPDAASSRKQDQQHRTTVGSPVSDRLTPSNLDMKHSSDQWKLIEVDQQHRTTVGSPVSDRLTPSNLDMKHSPDQWKLIEVDQQHRTTLGSAVSDRLTPSNLNHSSGQWKLIEVDHPNKTVSLLQRFRESKCSDPVATEQNTRPQTPLVATSDGLKEVNGGSVKHPPVSQVFPKSPLRRTILLDSPVIISTHTKQKSRIKESIDPKPDEKRLERKTCETVSARTAREVADVEEKTRRVLSDERHEPEEASKKRCCALPGRLGHKCTTTCEEFPRKSRQTEHDESPTRQQRKSRAYRRSPEQSPATACRGVTPSDTSSEEIKGSKNMGEVSSRKSRHTELDESPTPRQRRKSCSAYQPSPDGSPDRASAMKPPSSKSKGSESSEPSDILSRKSRRTEFIVTPTRQRRKSQSAYCRSPEGSPARASRGTGPSDTSCEEKGPKSLGESRKSRPTERDESPTPRQRRKSRSGCRRSPEGSPARASAMKPPRSESKESESSEPSDILSRKSRRTERDESPTRQRRRSRSAYQRSPERSPARASRGMPPSDTSSEEKGSKSLGESRKSRPTGRDESPTPRQRRKSRSDYQRSPEGSRVRASAMKPPSSKSKGSESSEPSDILSRKSRRTERDESPTRQRRRSRSAYQRSPDGSPARACRRVTPSDTSSEEIKRSKDLGKVWSRKSRRDESPTACHRRKSRSSYQWSPEGSRRVPGATIPFDKRSEYKRSKSCGPCDFSSREARRTERDESPIRHRSKSRSDYQLSPERSPARESRATNHSDDTNHAKSKIRSKSSGREPKSSKSSSTLESFDGKYENSSPKSSSSKQSKSRSSRKSDKRRERSPKPAGTSIVITAQAPLLEKAVPIAKTIKPVLVGKRTVKLGEASFINL